MTRAICVSGRVVLPVLAALSLAQGIARAQEPAPSPAPEPPRIDVTGFVDVYYGYNLNGVDPAFRTFDVQHNTFSLSLAEVAFSKTVSADSRLGFRVDLDFGKTADLVAAYEPAAGDSDVYELIQQGYGSLLTGKVQWDVGKFVTPIGAEVIESQDNWNYTRSMLFGYAIPFYHLGVRGTVPVNDKLSVTGFLLNGWNNASDTGGDKTFAVNATLKPTGSVTWYLNYMGGKELVQVDGVVPATRNLFDTTLSLAVSPKLSLMGNFDYGKEGVVTWWGFAGYAKLQASDSWALAGRYEYVDDSDGGFMTIGTKAQSVTVTSDHLLAGSLRARLEYRTDFADQPIFPKDDGSFRKSQTSFTVGLVYSFSGKI
jgi:hypothetical protein